MTALQPLQNDNLARLTHQFSSFIRRRPLAGMFVGGSLLLVAAASARIELHESSEENAPAQVGSAAVAVTPDRSHQFVEPNGFVGQTFTITNHGSAQGTFSYEVLCSGSVSSCNPTQGSVTLGAGLSTSVVVAFYSGEGTLGMVSMIARHNTDGVEDAAVHEVSVRAGNAMRVVVDEFNPDDAIARDQCVTIATVRRAAWECGDLRIIHPLPSTRTLNQDRTPVLVYSSQHAHPYPTISASVMLPSTADVTAQLVATLTVNGVQRATRTWPGSLFVAGQNRIITIAFDALNDTTGLYSYALDIVRHRQGGGQDLATGFGRLAIVNRKTSPFGAGWWLLGLEELKPLDGGRKFWIGGDGSTREYAFDFSQNAYAARSITHVDHLRDLGGGQFERLLPGGATVRFDATGRHVATRNRLGHETTFAYSSGRLSTITLPVPSGAAARTYDFGYCGGWLCSATAPPASTSRVNYFQGGSQITRIEENDGASYTDYAYDPLFPNRLVRRTGNHGNLESTFAYDSVAKLSEVTQMKLGQPGVPESVWRIQSQELKGWTGVGDPTFARLDGPRDPTTDVTRFYFNRYGAPRAIFESDAFERFTVVMRTNPNYPGILTRVEYPSADGGSTRRVQEATLNPRGRPTAITEVSPYGDPRNATTRYAYGDSVWLDFVTRIVPPLKDSTVVGYEPNGNRAWQEDARGSSTRVRFFYHTSGPGLSLLRSIDGPLTPEERFFYDPFGNLMQVRTPIGFDSYFYKDNIGRDTLTFFSTDSLETSDLRQRTRISHDALDRVVLTKTRARPQLGAEQDTLAVLYEYSPEFDDEKLSAVTRWSSPDVNGIGQITTRWERDAAGRVTQEIAPDSTPSDPLDNPRDVTTYDAAGNPIQFITRRGDTILMSYDDRNRLIERVTPRRKYGKRNEGIPMGPWLERWNINDPPYPWFPTEVDSSYVIAADTASFSYDAAGNMIRADNKDAQIRRTYFPGGALKADTAKIRATVTNDFAQHTYVLGYEYDLNGRRTNLVHPANLLPVGSPQAATSYFYHPQLGTLERVRSTQGDEFTYQFDLEGRVSALLHRPGGVDETYGYDDDSRLISHVAFKGPTVLRSTTIRYDARDRILFSGSATGPRDTLSSTFAGLGHVMNGQMKSNGNANNGEPAGSTTSETLTHDALGNLKSALRQTSYVTAGFTLNESGTTTYSYTTGTGRLRTSSLSGDVEHYTYDASGNLEFYRRTDDDATGELRDRASYYDAAGLLRAADARTAQFQDADPDDYTVAFEEYRYDALGRRVWVRARRLCEERNEGSNREYEGLCQLSKIRRTVWDGEKELYEIQMPGWDSLPSYLENDTASVQLENLFGRDAAWPWAIDANPFFGRVSYVHGASLNQPLSVIRAGYGNLLDSLNFEGDHTPFWTFAFSPIWNERGQPVKVVFSNGSSRYCEDDRCANLTLPLMWFAYVRASGNLLPSGWHGSLMEDKQDAAGTNFRRNRYYDPQSGRFTQEDPIGIAGGLNLYGYAEGDPVNFADPFGLAVGGCLTLRCAFGVILEREFGLNEREIENRLESFRPSQCTVARTSATVSVGLDIASAVSLGAKAGPSLVSVARSTIRQAGELVSPNVLSGAARATAEAELATASRALEREAATSLLVGGAITGMQHMSGAPTGFWDYVPVVSSVRAVQRADAACGG